MLPIITAVLGAIAGALTARRRGGKTFDVLQYAAVWAIIAGLLGLIALIVLARV
ncbi:MAG: hypothetical protein WBA67_17130 [Jannaschia sp.]